MKTMVMPLFGETPEEPVTVTRWLVQPGDSVTSGQAVAEVETDKTSMAVEATVAGIVGRILVEEGSSVVPGSGILEIEEQA